MHTLPDLPYDFSALEPHIDARTMEIHHDRHHAGYVKKLNAALESAASEYQQMTVEELLSNYADLPEELHGPVRNHGGGHANHSLFWQTLSPESGGQPSGELATELEATFGSVAEFKDLFEKTTTSQFGSGWGWLVLNSDNELEVYSTANQDSPLMRSDTPLLGVDVWEHAYYLHYQNKRADYVAAVWNVINWPQVADNLSAARS